MRKRSPQHPFEDNPFHEDFAAWLDSPEGQLSRDVSDTVSELLERADLDARNRTILWEDGRACDIEGCIEHIHGLFPDFPPRLIETHVLAWLECGFVPKGFSEAQMDDFEKRVERWIHDYQRQHRRGA
ncbi:MAG: hypothetical protein ACYCS1_08040 [Gammaproteobacteria bacterium]